VAVSLKHRKLLKYMLFATVVVWIAVGIQHWSEDTGPIKAPADRKPMRDLTLPQLDGSTWRLSDHRGQIVLVNYWATWCEPCRQETPGLVKLAHDYQPKGLAIVGVSMDEDRPATVREFAKYFRIPYPVLMGTSFQPFASNVEALPTTILVDTQGRAAKTYVGAVRESVFRADVDHLLAERNGNVSN